MSKLVVFIFGNIVGLLGAVLGCAACFFVWREAIAMFREHRAKRKQALDMQNVDTKSHR